MVCVWSRGYRLRPAWFSPTMPVPTGNPPPVTCEGPWPRRPPTRIQVRTECVLGQRVDLNVPARHPAQTKLSPLPSLLKYRARCYQRGPVFGPTLTDYIRLYLSFVRIPGCGARVL